MGQLCCKSKKGEKNRELREQFEEGDAAPRPEPRKQKKVEEETSATTEKSKAQDSPFKGNQYESDFLKFIDTHAMFKVDRSEIASPEGHLKFDFFLKLYKSSMMWNKILFLETKQEMVKERRSLLSTDSPVASNAYK